MAHSSIRGSTESTPPKRPGEPCCALVDAALSAYELIERHGIGLVRRGVPHDAGPLASGPFVSLGRVSGAPDDCGEWTFPILYKILCLFIVAPPEFFDRKTTGTTGPGESASTGSTLLGPDLPPSPYVCRAPAVM
jgi:hypothetical protein